MTAGAIEIAGAVKRFGRTTALDGLDLGVRPGELFAVLGPSGCGKTTLLRVIAGFERPQAGTVSVGGEPVAGPGRWLPPERRQIGMVFQDYALFPHLTVERNVAFGLRKLAAEDRAGRVRSALDLVGLQHKAGRHPHELSGGERQRVALARALAPAPAVVLLDEPFSNLDASLRAELRREVELILREAEATVVLVTHDQEEALSLADRLAVMRSGRIVQVGPPQDVYYRPAHRWVAQFVGDVNLLPGYVAGDGVETDVGLFDVHGHSLPERTSVRLAVRPEQLDFSPDRLGNAVVTDREFRGHDVLYRLRHEIGRDLVVQLPSVRLAEIGETVMVRPGESRCQVLED